MKQIFTILTFAGVLTASAQTTITSVANGLAASPFTWDCTCIPGTNDHVVINHDVSMNSDWIVNGGGSITVNAGGSFIEDASYRSILFDGTNSTFTNHGISEFTNFGFTNGAVGHNHGALSLDTGLYVDASSTFMNHATLTDLDSTYSEGMLMNEGQFYNGSFWNAGMLTNTGLITADSLLNTGTLNSSAGSIEVYDFANTNVTNISGTCYMIVDNDFSNTGEFMLATGRDVSIGNDMFNGDFDNSAMIQNDGLFEIGNDFTNTDTLRGAGIFCIANQSANSGQVQGTLDICDNTGTGIFDTNIGTIDVTVTDCVSGCNVSVEEDVVINLSIHPNPASNVLYIDYDKAEKFNVIDISGKVVMQTAARSSIDVSELNSGIYFIAITYGDNVKTLKFIKQ